LVRACDGRLRRFSAAQPSCRERLFLPLKRPCRWAQAPAEKGGKRPFAPLLKWILATLVPFYLVIRYGVIAREEVYLECKFGAVYLGYKSRVRRWL
jgi:hypothetical protein